MIFGGFSMPVFLIFITCSKVMYYYCSCGFFVLVVQPSTAISIFSWPVKNVAPHPVPSNVTENQLEDNKISKLKGGEEKENTKEDLPKFFAIIHHTTYDTLVVTASACHFFRPVQKVFMDLLSIFTVAACILIF